MSRPRPLLAPWLSEGSTWLVYAAAGVGKTFFSLNVAFAVASGGSYLGWYAGRPRRVLFCDGEMQKHELQERVCDIYDAAVRDANGSPEAGDKNLYLYPATGQAPGEPFPDLSSKRGLSVLMRKAEHADLIIIDNLSTTMRMNDENEAAYWRVMQEALIELRKRNKAVLLVHHANKQGDQRGTSAKDVILTGKIKLDRPKDYSPSEGSRFVIQWEKARELRGDQQVPVEARLSEDPEGLPMWAHRVIDHSRHTELLRLAASGEHGTQQEIAEAMGVAKSYVTKLKGEAIRDGLITSRQWNDYLRAGQEARDLNAPLNEDF